MTHPTLSFDLGREHSRDLARSSNVYYRSPPILPEESERRHSSLPRVSVGDNIVIPAHLLATVSDHTAWSPDNDPRRQSNQASAGRTDTLRNFDVVRIARRQSNALQRRIERANSVNLAGLARSHSVGKDTRANAFAVADPTHPRWPKTSLPTIPSTALLSRKDRVPSPQHEQPTRTSNVEDQRVSDTVLFTSLSTYDLRHRFKQDPAGALDGSRRISEDIDPFSDRAAIRDGSYFASVPLDDDMIAPGDGEKSRSAPGYISRSGTMRSDRSRKMSIVQGAAETVINAVQTANNAVTSMLRRSSLHEVYEKAKVTGQRLERKKWVQVSFEYFVYLLGLAFIYFVLVGIPLWKGAVWWLYWVVDHKFVVAGTWSITIGLAVLYAFAPLLMLFEKEPPMPEDTENIDATQTPGVHNVALLIPCYKSANIVGPTLEAALKVFPRDHIFVIANGNSPTPLDNTEEVCNRYGVNHIWSPIGSKIVAQFVGCYAAKHFENVLLIDDDCALPANFPIVSDRLTGKVKCIGYTIKSVGPNSAKGTLCQQAQDLEYKLSGLQRQFAGFIGSATFPHGAISLWNTKFLIDTFFTHPGFSVSEDWFFGHVARKLGCRIKMCSAIFVETETPSAIFFSGGGSRGGFGEMTIFKQRFYRWNFFFVNGMYYNMAYILGSWKLGFWEFGAKLFVWQEVYETLLYLVAPFMLPISLIVRPAFCGYLTAGTFMLYFLNVTIFNEIHLRLRNERVGFVALYLYYMPYKAILTLVNIASCYYSLYKYAKYFAKRHPKVIEDEKAVEVVMRLDERQPTSPEQAAEGRRMTIGAVGLRLASIDGRLSISPEDVRAEHRLTRIVEGEVSAPTQSEVMDFAAMTGSSAVGSRLASTTSADDPRSESPWHAPAELHAARAPALYTIPTHSEAEDLGASPAPSVEDLGASPAPSRPISGTPLIDRVIDSFDVVDERRRESIRSYQTHESDSSEDARMVSSVRSLL